MADNKLWTLVRRLNAETHRGKIAWEKTAEDGNYQATFPGYTVVIGASDDPQSEGAFLRIHDAEGEVVDTVSDDDLDTGTGGHVAYKLMMDTYRAARRTAMGVEKALDAILSTLEPTGDEEVPF